MSLYEATAHLFYGVRIQRTGRDADTTLPLGPEVDTHDGVEERLKALGHTLPDWRGLLNSKDPNDKEADAKVTVMLRECQALIEAASFGCELLEMGSGDQEDFVVYAVIKASDKSCSSEDDHGGFGERVLKPEDLVIGEGWDDQLAKFCALMEVPAELVKPRWTLSMRG